MPCYRTVTKGSVSAEGRSKGPCLPTSRQPQVTAEGRGCLCSYRCSDHLAKIVTDR